MPGSERVRPPWWLKQANKFFIFISHLGLSYGRAGPAVLTVPGRCAVFRLDPL